MRQLLILLIFSLVGCSSGAVVFAPTPAPPDTSPLRYTHPSGAFALMVPRQWPVFTQNATTLAAASFAPPNSSQTLVTAAVVNLGEPVDSATFGNLIDQYQTTIRSDATRYKEESRQAMGDGSWRLTGLRRNPGGSTQQINTFIERSGSLLAVVDVTLPEDPQRQAELQSIVNSFQILPDTDLAATDSSALVSLTTSSLDIANLGTWTTPEGVFYITGEVANYGPTALVNLPVHAILRDENGITLAEAVDSPLGLALLPGGFAPFSLRFGQGQPAQASRFEITLGGPEWQPETATDVYGPGNLDWIDESGFDDDGALLITGTVTNIGSLQLRDLRATATVFDAGQRVIGARFEDLDTGPLSPNDSAEFRIVLPELGSSPAQYVVNVQARGEANDSSDDTGA